MSNMNTQWRITVAADTKAARSELAAFAKTAQGLGVSMEQMFSNVKGAPVARTFNNMGRELDKMNSSLLKSQVTLKDFNKYWQNSNNLIRHSKQLQQANSIAIEKTNGSLVSATASMKRFKDINVSAGERLAYMNTFFRQASRSALNFSKNIQWAGRQITVGFGVPFGLAMTGASMAFLKVEDQLVRFRKVFNDEINSMNVEEAEERVLGLANNLSTSLGIARTEVLETAATFAQMGYVTEEIERLTKATTELAMLGEIDATQATSLLRAYSASGFKDDFKGPVDEFEDYIKNMLNSIENNTGLTIAAMARDMAQLVPLFHQFGLEAGEGESIIAGMTEALGGNSSEAVTALKAIMQRFYSETKATRDEFAKLGIDIEALQTTYKDDIVGGLAELGNILDNNPAFDSDNQAVADTFGRLFGVRQSNRAIAGLRAINTAYSENGEALNDYGRSLNVIAQDEKNAARASAELAAQAESMGGRIKRLKETILIEASEIGQSFLEMIMPLAEMIGSAIKWFNDLGASTKKFYMTSGLVILGLSGMLTAVGVLGQAFIYLLKTVGFFIPKFRTWTEETFKTNLATNHLNESLRDMRESISSIVPKFDSIEKAQLEVARATNTHAQAVERLNTANKRSNSGAGMAGYSVGKSGMWGGTSTRTGMPMNPSGYSFGKGPASTSKHRQNVYEPGTSQIGGGAYKDKAGQYLTTPGMRLTIKDTKKLEKAADRVIEQIVATTAVHSASTRNVRREKRMASSLSRNEKVMGTSKSAVKWRGGASAAGGLLSMGGMLAGNSGMVGAGMGIEAITMLASPKLKKAMAAKSTELIRMSKASKGFGSAMKGVRGSVLSIATTMPAIGVAAAAVGAAGWLIYKNIKKSREEAEALKTEIELASDVGNELGLTLQESGGFNLGESSEEDLEKMSDSMRSLIETVEKAKKDSPEQLKGIFRNMARDWERGGASIEEINQKLNDLEAIVGVEIDEVSVETLATRVGEDISEAIARSMEGFTGNDRFWEFGTDKEFSADNEQALRGAAIGLNTAAQFNPEELNGALQAMRESLDSSDVSSRARVDAEKRIMEYLRADARLPELVARQAESTEDMLYLIARSNIEGKISRGEIISQKDRDFMNEVAALVGDEDGIVNSFIKSDDIKELERYNSNLFATQMLFSQVGQIAPDLVEVMNLKDAQNNLVNLKTSVQRALESTGHGYSRNLSLIENLERAISDTATEAEKATFQNMVNDLLAAEQVLALIEARAANIVPAAASGIDHHLLNPKSRRPGFKPTPAATSEVADAGEDDAKDYSSAFRSELDNQRSKVISSILEAFDKASEERMKRLEDERDARIEALESIREADIESIGEARDADIKAIDDRIKAIDDYLDKQREINEARQGEIDLITALAKGDRGAAAQIQNSMRFGDIEEMAENAKDALNDEQEKAEEFYEEREEAQEEYHEKRIEDETDLFEKRITNEKNFRDQRKSNLERSLKELDTMFLGTQRGWNDFIAKAEGIAGTRIPKALRNGFDVGMADARKKILEDNMWEKMGKQIGKGVASGLEGEVDKALNRTIPTPKKTIWDGWMSQMEGMVDGAVGRGVVSGGITGAEDIRAAMDAYDRGTWDNFTPKTGTSKNDFGILKKYHTGGSVGAGPARDVPAILQTGEYVIQRNAVKSLGVDYLNQLNKYHTGGFVGVGEKIGRSMMGTFDPEPPRDTGSSAGVNFGGSDSGRSGWMNEIPSRIAKSFVNTLAQIPGGQYITSGWRSASHNKRIGGSPNSDHLTGKALDFVDKNDKSLARLNWMGSFFQGKPGVRWVGMPKTDKSGGHNDHVHVSYLHSGGMAGSNMIPLMKGGRLKQNNVPAMLHRGETVLRAPVAKNLEAGIQNMSRNSDSSVSINIENFNGTRENVDLLVKRIEEHQMSQHRRVNSSRSFG